MSGTGPDEIDEPALLEELGRALGHDPSEAPPPDRVAALRAAAAARQPAPEPPAAVTGLRQPSRRRAVVTGGIAAAVAGIAGYLVADARQPDATTAAAVPVELITFAGDADVSTSELINHSWGTELVLDVTGLPAGRAYQVVYDTDAGEVAAGSLLAVADVVMKCRFNAAPVRSVVHAIEVRSPAGAAVLRAELPDAT